MGKDKKKMDLVIVIKEITKTVSLMDKEQLNLLMEILISESENKEFIMEKGS